MFLHFWQQGPTGGNRRGKGKAKKDGISGSGGGGNGGGGRGSGAQSSKGDVMIKKLSSSTNQNEGEAQDDDSLVKKSRDEKVAQQRGARKGNTAEAPAAAAAVAAPVASAPVAPAVEENPGEGKSDTGSGARPSTSPSDSNFGFWISVILGCSIILVIAILLCANCRNKGTIL